MNVPVYTCIHVCTKHVTGNGWLDLAETFMYRAFCSVLSMQRITRKPWPDVP